MQNKVDYLTETPALLQDMCLPKGLPYPECGPPLFADRSLVVGMRHLHPSLPLQHDTVLGQLHAVVP